MAAVEFLLIVLLGAALAVTSWLGLREHDGRLAAESALASTVVSRGSQVGAANRSAVACVGEGKAGVRAGQAIARIAHPVAPVAGAPQPIISAKAIRDVVAP